MSSEDLFEQELPDAGAGEGFEGVEFVENPEPRCPCVVLLDTSEAMEGEALSKLKAGLERFRKELQNDELTAKRVDVALVSFGPVRVVSSFSGIDELSLPSFQAQGEACLGEAVELAVEMVAERKELYKANGVQYYRPWILVITAGQPSADWSNAAELVRVGEAEGSFAFYAVGVEGADMSVLSLLSLRTPRELNGLSFAQLFSWLGRSLQLVSHSQVQAAFEFPELPVFA